MSKITEFLKSLGNSSNEIAENLQNMDIKGEIGNPDFCPIIKAIYKQFPNMSRGLKAVFYYYPSGYRSLGYYGYVWMNGKTIFQITWNDYQTIDPDCPEAIGKFVKDFDSGKYPFLIGKSKKELKKELLNKLTVEEKMILGI